MTEGVWLVAVPAGVAAALAVLFRLTRPGWSRRRGILTAALPLPVLGAAPCIWLFASASLASAEKCGVDACGMAMVFAMFGLVYAAVALALGALVAACIIRKPRPA